MKTIKIADKIICFMYRDFIENGNELSCAENLVSHFPNESPHLVHAAIRLLSSDGLLSVLYCDNEPGEIVLNVQAVRQCDENTMLKKGYKFVTVSELLDKKK